MRGAGPAIALAAALAAALITPARAEDVRFHAPAVISAEYAAPTTRYDHGVLGDAVEWGALVVMIDECPRCAGIRLREVKIELPPERVFEDIAPRLADVTGDGRAEVVVVESDLRRGARLALWQPPFERPFAATAFIGRKNRWLAPLGAADLDGDGRDEIAYVDRPHLARELVIVEWREGSDALAEVARVPGHTNHRIGEDFVQGGIADCPGGPVIVTADPAWRRVQATRLEGGVPVTRDAGPYRGPESLAPGAPGLCAGG